MAPMPSSYSAQSEPLDTNNDELEPLNAPAPDTDDSKSQSPPKENKNNNSTQNQNNMSSNSETLSDDGTSSPLPPPSQALLQLLAPDGYYTYLKIPKADVIEEDQVKKNYRKLSLKHHPDKRGGDAETFRVLNRAQKVLMAPKLKQQYDILGLDLDDDEEHHKHDDDDDDGRVETSTTQGIVHEIASMALTNVLQLGVRTLMMGAVSIIVVRYRWTLVPALLFLAYIAFRIHKVTPGSGDMLSPFMIAVGLIVMHLGGFWLYLAGESLVIYMFTWNSLGPVAKTTPLYLGVGLFSFLSALWFRGKFWNYILVIGLELFLALFIALAFPIMEMVLEAILNDKLKKVGDKVRAHHAHLERYYNAQKES